MKKCTIAFILLIGIIITQQIHLQVIRKDAANDCKVASIELEAQQRYIEAATDNVVTLQKDLCAAAHNYDSLYAAYIRLTNLYNYEMSYYPAEMRYYDIPLAASLQDYIYAQSKNYQVDYRIILAMIRTESNFDTSVVSSTSDYGLMQINACNHAWLRDLLGIDNLLDPYQNIHAGTYIISTLYHKYGTYEKALVAYNMGEAGAAAYWSTGKTASIYSDTVLKNYSEYIDK